MARVRLANPIPLVRLQHHPYQIQFMQARRLRVCASGHAWDRLPICPHCGLTGQRAYNRMLLRAGRRGGKTRIGALAVIEELTTPDVLWWVCAPTYPELEDFVMPAFFKQIPQAWMDDPRTEWRETDKTLILPNRATVQFRSLEDPERGRGPGLHGLWIDEICKLTKYHWEVIAPTLADFNGLLIATTTPKGEDWVHEEFWERMEHGQPGFWGCTYRTVDNPFISPDVVAAAKASMSELMFRQEYEADIVTFTGAIYGEYVPRCEIEGTDEEMTFYFPEWPRLDLQRPAVAGLDPGTDHPFAFTQLVASPKGLVVVGEYEQRQKPYFIHVEQCRLVQRGFRSSRCGIDRSQAQAKIELAQYGFFTVDAENDVVPGINRVTAWMLKNRIDPTSKLPVGGLIIPRRYAPTMLKRLKGYRWADTEKRDGSTSHRELVYKKHDDLPDALRYGLMTYPVLPSADPTIDGVTRRDLSLLPPHVANEIQRLRRAESGEAGEDGEDGAYTIEGVGDMWGHQD